MSRPCVAISTIPPARARAATTRLARRAGPRRTSPNQAAAAATNRHRTTHTPCGKSSIATTIASTTVAAASTIAAMAASLRRLMTSSVREPAVAHSRGGRANRRCRLRGNRRHIDANPRPGHGAAQPRGRLFAPLARCRGSARHRRWGFRTPRSEGGPRLGGRDGHDHQPRLQAAQQPPPSRPRRSGGSGRPPRAHADLELVPVGPLGGCLRLRHRRRTPVPRRSRTAPRPGGPGGLLAGAHGRPLSRRRHRRLAPRCRARPSYRSTYPTG